MSQRIIITTFTFEHIFVSVVSPDLCCDWHHFQSVSGCWYFNRHYIHHLNFESETLVWELLVPVCDKLWTDWQMVIIELDGPCAKTRRLPCFCRFFAPSLKVKSYWREKRSTLTEEHMISEGNWWFRQLIDECGSLKLSFVQKPAKRFFATDDWRRNWLKRLWFDLRINLQNDKASLWRIRSKF